MFFILIAIQASLLLYTDGTQELTDIWTFVTNMDNWTSLPWILGLVGIAGAIIGLGIAGGGSFRFLTDSILWAPAIAGLISIGVVFIQLGNLMRKELIATFFTACGIGINCAPVNFIVAVTLGPFAFYYVWTVVEYWRGKDY